MYQRQAAELIKRLAKGFPVISISGPRQSGKTTLAKMLFPHLPYVLFENFENRQDALNDPKSFLARYPDGAIFDEVQHAPLIVSYLQGIVDEDQRPGRFVITGSQNFVISNTVSQSLAGRVGVVTLLPLSINELNNRVSWQDAAFMGGYPRLHAQNILPGDYYSSYLHTYVERDVRQLISIGDVERFQNFIKLCAGRIGQVLNVSSLALDANISPVTARSWLSVLEASYVIFRLAPYYKNYSKRLIKQKKLYFYDTGLASYLLGIKNTKDLSLHFSSGHLFKNLVIAEIMKNRFNQGETPWLYFWRDHRGLEVDLIAEWDGAVHAIEIKSSATFRPDLIKSIQTFCTFEDRAKGHLVYNGHNEGMHLGVQLLPFLSVGRLGTLLST